MDEATIKIAQSWEKAANQVEAESLELRLRVNELLAQIKNLDTRAANLRRWIAEKKAEQSQSN